jgi:hypothetical protein
MPSPRERKIDELLTNYIASFSAFDGMRVFADLDPITAQFATGESASFARSYWKPRQIQTDASALEQLYAKLPSRFPPLFERLLLTYRWAEVDLQNYRLLPNPLGADLGAFLAGMSGDHGLWESLMPAGYMQFGRCADIDYDPVCFDIGSRKKSREMRVVKIDHEEILCNYKVKVVAELSPSFEALVQNTIALARRVSSKN